MLTLNGGPRSVSTSSNPLIVWRASDHYTRETQAILPPRTFNWDLVSPIRFIICMLFMRRSYETTYSEVAKFCLKEFEEFLTILRWTPGKFISFYQYIFAFVVCPPPPFHMETAMTLATYICFILVLEIIKLWSRQYFNEISHICLLICES